MVDLAEIQFRVWAFRKFSEAAEGEIQFFGDFGWAGTDLNWQGEQESFEFEYLADFLWSSFAARLL